MFGKHFFVVVFCVCNLMKFDTVFVVAVLYPLSYYHHKHPVNYILLGLFTVCISFAIGLTSAFTDGKPFFLVLHLLRMGNRINLVTLKFECLLSCMNSNQNGCRVGGNYQWKMMEGLRWNGIRFRMICRNKVYLVVKTMTLKSVTWFWNGMTVWVCHDNASSRWHCLSSNCSNAVISLDDREGNSRSSDPNSRGGRWSHFVHVLGRQESLRLQFSRALLVCCHFRGYSLLPPSGIYDRPIFPLSQSFASGISFRVSFTTLSCGRFSFPWVRSQLWSMDV